MAPKRDFVSFLSVNGSILIQPLTNDDEVIIGASLDDKFENYSGVCFTSDNKFLAIVHSSGVLSIHQVFTEQTTSKRRGSNLLIYPESTEEASSIVKSRFIDFIDESSHQLDSGRKLLSFQDQRKQEAKEKQRQFIETQKAIVQKKILDLQHEYHDLAVKNSCLSENCRLTDKEMIVDTSTLNDLEVQKATVLKEVELQCLYETEKSFLRLQKLKRVFVDCLEFEKFKVKSLVDSIYIESFPVKKMMINENEAIKKDDNSGGTKITQQSVNVETSPMRTRPIEKTHRENTDLLPLSAFDKRKSMRLRRKHEIQAKIHNAPSADLNDEAYQKIVVDVLSNLGDHKLKSSKEYIPTENDIDPDFRKCLLKKIERKIYDLKVIFNGKLNKFRVDKRKLKNQIEKTNHRLCEIAKFIGDSNETIAEIPSITIESDEFPEERSVISQDDVNSFRKILKDCKEDPLICCNVPMHEVISANNNGEFLDHGDANKLTCSCGEDAFAYLSLAEKDDYYEERQKLVKEQYEILSEVEKETERLKKIFRHLRLEKCNVETKVRAGELQVLVLQHEIDILSTDIDKSRELKDMKSCLEHERDIVSDRNSFQFDNHFSCVLNCKDSEKYWTCLRES